MTTMKVTWKGLSELGKSVYGIACTCLLVMSIGCSSGEKTGHKSSSSSSGMGKFLLSPRVVLGSGLSSESDLPVCEPWSVCNKVDTYAAPWAEKQCKCPDGQEICSLSVDSEDGHTILDKNRQFKVCESVASLPTCRLFRDVTWTVTSFADNRTMQTVHCTCPKDSVAYIFKHEGFVNDAGTGYKYHFACSPESRLKCKHKEPCRLFTVRKRPDIEEVNANTLCQCSRGFTCPGHHNEPSVIPGTTYPFDHIRTYSGFCSAENKQFHQLNSLRRKHERHRNDPTLTHGKIDHSKRRRPSSSNYQPQRRRLMDLMDQTTTDLGKQSLLRWTFEPK